MRADKPLRILVAHNRYQRAGGEDSVFASEVGLMRSGGCEVETLEVSNDHINGIAASAKAALGVIYNCAGRKMVDSAIARFQPDIVHVHNFFPRLSPSIFDACEARGIPAVWTLHNFRIACANGLLFRDGRPCENCIGGSPFPAIRYACYRDSKLGSATVAAMIAWHRERRTWQRKVARFIALSDFARKMVIKAGLPAERVCLKPNFVADPLPALELTRTRRGALFVGRISREKGVGTLIEAWRALPEIPLTIIGDGPELSALSRIAPGNVQFLGLQSREKAIRAMAEAQAVIVPSEWYEAFGLVVGEAFSVGTPVIASRIGALATLITNGRDGLHFETGDAFDLARTVKDGFADGGRLERMGDAARAKWQLNMAPEQNLAQLLAIYREAMNT